MISMTTNRKPWYKFDIWTSTSIVDEQASKLGGNIKKYAHRPKYNKGRLPERPQGPNNAGRLKNIVKYNLYINPINQSINQPINQLTNPTNQSFIYYYYLLLLLLLLLSNAKTRVRKKLGNTKNLDSLNRRALLLLFSVIYYLVLFVIYYLFLISNL